MIKQEQDYVAVYGSLKKGFHNNALLSDSEYVCDIETCKSFNMISLGTYPAIVVNHRLANSIVCELYKVDKKTLQELDAFEDHPGFYIRTLIFIDITVNGKERTISAWIYALNQDSNFRIASGKIQAEGNCPSNSVLKWTKDRKIVEVALS